MADNPIPKHSIPCSSCGNNALSVLKDGAGYPSYFYYLERGKPKEPICGKCQESKPLFVGKVVVVEGDDLHGNPS